jgi:hypothetical protein
MSKTVSRYNTHAEWYGEGLARSECKRASLREASFCPRAASSARLWRRTTMLPPPANRAGPGLVLALHPTVHWGSRGASQRDDQPRVADVEDRMLKARTQRQGMSFSDVIQQYVRRALIETSSPKKRGRKVGPAPLQPGRTPWPKPEPSEFRLDQRSSILR